MTGKHLLKQVWTFPWKAYFPIAQLAEWGSHLFCQHIEAETKWTPFRRRHFQTHFRQWIFSLIPIKVSLKFVHKGLINNIPASVKIMAWRQPGDKPSSEPIMVGLPTHICVTRPHVHQLSILCESPTRNGNAVGTRIRTKSSTCSVINNANITKMIWGIPACVKTIQLTVPYSRNSLTFFQADCGVRGNDFCSFLVIWIEMYLHLYLLFSPFTLVGFDRFWIFGKYTSTSQWQWNVSNQYMPHHDKTADEDIFAHCTSTRGFNNAN